jgi:hypothetical protein
MGRNLLIFLVVLLLIAAGSAFYFWSQLNNLESGEYQASEAEIEEIIAKVSQLIELPTGEDPTVATVSEPDKLRDQAFFAKAKVGDKVLIYTKARKAVLYDPVANKIIEVAPLNINQ